jgi:hypothetical protein
MATKKRVNPEEPKPNREQRRRQKFGHAGGATKDPWPQSEANPVFGQGGPADDAGEATGDPAAHTGRPDQDVTHQTGPGSGGATEGSGRIVDREGIHSGDSAKG